MIVRGRQVAAMSGLMMLGAACLAFSAWSPMAARASIEPSPAIPLDRPIEFPTDKAPCPEGMAFIERTYCIDRWEASLVLVTDQGEEPFSPYISMTDSRVRAVTRPNVYPQAYVSREDAQIACASAGKRLCKADEWLLACHGAHSKKFPYGNSRRTGTCNDEGRQGAVSPLHSLFSRLGAKMFSFHPMNDPRLNTLPGTLAKTGSHADCVSDYGVYDMVGNLHEWIDEPVSTFRGGYYLDTHINGDGCDYRTIAHGPTYHDYSTGFRCCADIPQALE